MKKILTITLVLSLTILIICTFSTVGEAKVVEREGAGEVTSVEPQTKFITLKIDGVIHMFAINKDTTFKGATGLQDINEEDEVFVQYKIDEHGRKILVLLEKKASD